MIIKIIISALIALTFIINSSIQWKKGYNRGWQDGYDEAFEFMKILKDKGEKDGL